MTSKVPQEISAKLQRAQEHAMALLVENTDYYFNTKPYLITIERADDVGFNHTVYISFTEPLPAIFAIRTGEALYQLRSVLDHVVMLLSEVPPNCRRPEFVITLNRDSFNGASRHRRLSSRLDDIREPRARSFIEAVQPFNQMSGDPAEDPLWILHELFMADKHRRLLLTQAGSHGSRVIPIYPGVRNIHFTSGALRTDETNRAVLARVVLINPLARVDLDIRPMLTVAFGDESVARGKIVHSTLESIILRTAFVVDTLCGYL